jgi:hypothetical protein
MADRKAFPRQRLFTIDEQTFCMSVRLPEVQLAKRRRQVEAAWRGSVQPTPLSGVYTVSLRFPAGWCPEVRVLNLELKLREGADGLPHIYPEGSL